MTYELHQSSVLALPLADESVQCVVTSPPYFGLRSYEGNQVEVWGGDPEHEHMWSEYAVAQQTGGTGRSTLGEASGGHAISPAGQDRSQKRQQTEARTASFCDCGAWRGALGLEPTPDLYVEHIVSVFREVRRVLRKDGTLWLVLGDSYATQGGTGAQGKSGQRASRTFTAAGSSDKGVPAGLKPKDLVGIPWRVALALQADGWWLRSDIIWSKNNTMPESVRDRPTRAHEYMFLLTKSARYFYDGDAIREPSSGQSGAAADFARQTKEHVIPGQSVTQHRIDRKSTVDNGSRNARTVWTISTQPYKGAHFAAFPEELAEKCVLAGSSPQACAVCGAPWKRVTRRGDDPTYIALSERVPDDGRTDPGNAPIKRGAFGSGRPILSVDWQPTCKHDDGSGLSVVLDPFCGSGTTVQVAHHRGRHGIGVDISDEYLKLAQIRIEQPLRSDKKKR